MPEIENPYAQATVENFRRFMFIEGKVNEDFVRFLP